MRGLVIGGLGGGGAGGAEAADGDFRAVDLAAGGEGEGGLEGERVLDGDVADVAAGFAVKVGVLLQIRAIAGGGAVEIHLPDEAAVGEGFEAIVNGGQGNAGDFFLHAEKDLGRGGVIPLSRKGFEDLAALFGQAVFRAEAQRETALAGGRQGVGGIRDILTGHRGS